MHTNNIYKILVKPIIYMIMSTKFIANSFIFIFAIIFINAKCICQNNSKSYANKIFSMTTIVRVYSGSKIGQATAFYYQSPQNDVYLVSNRHVFYPGEKYPDSIIFNLRKADTINKRDRWHPIKLEIKFLQLNLKLHTNNKIDVASININEHVLKPKSPLFYQIIPVTQPDTATLNLENFEIGDDILVLGYPKGYYDEFNLIPIMKAGIISSFYRTNFNNLPCFLIDNGLFHGSSGSIVISKFKPLIISNQEPLFSLEKSFTFLGIFSGAPYILGPQVETDDAITIKKEYLDLGKVWYPWVLNELR